MKMIPNDVEMESHDIEDDLNIQIDDIGVGTCCYPIFDPCFLYIFSKTNFKNREKQRKSKKYVFFNIFSSF